MAFFSSLENGATPLLGAFLGCLKINATKLPYVQIVGEKLLAGLGAGATLVSREDVEQLGPLVQVIGGYLLHALSRLGDRQLDAERILVALTRLSGVRGQGTPAQLQAETGLPAARLRQLLGELKTLRLVRELDDHRYEIAHDYLAQLVRERLVDAEERDWKAIREVLTAKALNYERSGVLLEPEEMRQLYAHRQRLSPTLEELHLLCRSVLAGRGPGWYWLTTRAGDLWPALVQAALSDPVQVEVRRQAVLAAARLSGPEILLALRECLRDRDPQVQRAAMQAVGQKGDWESLPLLRERLFDEDPDVRRAAVQAISQMGDPASLPLLREWLQDHNGSVREAAVQAMGPMRDPASLPLLRARLRDSNPWVRRAAAEAVGQRGDRESLPLLRARLQDDHKWVQATAVRAIGQLADPASLPLLRECLRDRDPDLRRAAVEAVGRLEDRESLPLLRGLLQDDDRWVREAAVEAVGRLEDRESLPLLRGLLQDGRESVRQAAAQAVGRMGDRESLFLLGKRLCDGDPDVQRAAEESLRRLVDETTLPLLEKWLEDSQWQVRKATIDVLVRALGTKAVVRLRPCLDDRARSVRQAAIKGLAWLRDRESVSAIRGRMNDESPDVRRAAMRALAQLKDDVAVPLLRRRVIRSRGEERQTALESFLQLAPREQVLNWLEETQSLDINTLKALDAHLYLPAALREVGNPFVVGEPVEEGPAFARRPELLQRVWNRLATGSVLLYGEWRMGKTTLLRQVEREATAEYVPVFVSLQACEEGRFFRFLAEQTASALREELGEVGPELKVDAAADLPAHDYAHSDLPRLLRWLQERRGRNVRVLWLLDEVDLLNTYPLTLQNQFRGLLQSYPTELRVLAAGRQPHRPTTPLPTSSPWYNMFEMVEVPPWTEQEARGLLQSAVRGRYTWEEYALAFLVRTAQGVPYLLQLLARGALERARSVDRTRITLDDVREAFRTEFFAADPAVWQPVWAALPEAVQEALRVAAACEHPALDAETWTHLDAAGFLRAGEITVPRPLAEWLQEGN